jgi:aspartate/methionine/tyrosine aminotransferase
VKDAAIRAIRQGRTFYTESLGLPELREKIAQQYGKLHGVHVAPERVIVTNGTSGAFLLLSSVLLGRGRNMVLPDPGYPCYKNFGMLADAFIKPVHVSVDSHFEITPDALRRLSAVPHLLLIANPSNPTGSLYEDDSLARLWHAVSRKGGLMVVDEIYSGLVYDRTFRTALTLSDEIIVVNGFSKTHAMTGWRLGWMVVPEALVRPIRKWLKTSSYQLRPYHSMRPLKH